MYFKCPFSCHSTSFFAFLLSAFFAFRVFRGPASPAPPDLDTIFGALSHPTRRAILLRLRSGPASVGELAEPFHVTQQAISKQIAVLRSAGLVEQRKQGRETVCTLRTASLEVVAQWIELYRSLWEERFDKLADYLARPSSDKKEANE
jgi:DNA-binding transcriptional ArsR family regulator